MTIKKSNIQQRIRLPSDLSVDQVRSLGNRILEQNRNNARNGIDGSGRSMPGYSSSYKESLDFKNAGKTSKVTLTQTGDMLAELSVIDYGIGYVTIGYTLDNPEAAKAHGNVTGEYGQQSSTGKDRPFIGIPPNQLERLIAEIRSETLDQRTTEEASIDFNIRSILSRFGLGGFNES